eukprot:TRINITY_DN30748_c0_g1_i1.p2 TRINITY_DN30748_c0_g1~~TRINITY_DN30748_c0_g1_i1.p2  ORF type:complete len:102 (+),score=17.93 TRINITY_DN30748_c0_g1_i1:629-934(+)
MGLVSVNALYHVYLSRACVWYFIDDSRAVNPVFLGSGKKDDEPEAPIEVSTISMGDITPNPLDNDQDENCPRPEDPVEKNWFRSRSLTQGSSLQQQVAVVV